MFKVSDPNSITSINKFTMVARSVEGLNNLIPADGRHRHIPDRELQASFVLDEADLNDLDLQDMTTTMWTTLGRGRAS